MFLHILIEIYAVLPCMQVINNIYNTTMPNFIDLYRFAVWTKLIGNVIGESYTKVSLVS